MNKIHLIRKKKVMLDKDLAELYEVKPIRLREQVKRNLDRFPTNFMFQLTSQEASDMVSQFAIPCLKPKKPHSSVYPILEIQHKLLKLIYKKAPFQINGTGLSIEFCF